MSKIKKIALTSLVSMSMLSSVAFATPQDGLAEAKMITTSVNNGATVACPTAAMQVGNAVAKDSGLSGSALHAYIVKHLTAAASAVKIQTPECISDVVISDVACKISGSCDAAPGILAKAGGSGMGGNAGTIAAALAAAAAIAIIADNNDDDDDISK